MEGRSHGWDSAGEGGAQRGGVGPHCPPEVPAAQSPAPAHTQPLPIAAPRQEQPDPALFFWGGGVCPHPTGRTPTPQSSDPPLPPGWWFDACGLSNLNGAYYQNGQHLRRMDGVRWQYFRGPGYSLRATRMMIRPMGG